MAPFGVLWGRLNQRQTKVILSVAAINGLELAQPEFSFQNRPQQFTTKFPFGKIPAFEGADGLKLIEGTTIARYLSGIGSINLLGHNPNEVAMVDQWVHFAEHEIGALTANISGMIYGYRWPFNLEALEKHYELILRPLTYLELHLATRPSGYVALDTLTLADYVVASVIFTAARSALGAAERARFPHIFAHYTKVTSDERVKQYWGTEQFVDVRITEYKPVTFA